MTTKNPALLRGFDLRRGSGLGIGDRTFDRLVGQSPDMSAPFAIKRCLHSDTLEGGQHLWSLSDEAGVGLRFFHAAMLSRNVGDFGDPPPTVWSNGVAVAGVVFNRCVLPGNHLFSPWVLVAWMARVSSRLFTLRFWRAARASNAAQSSGLMRMDRVTRSGTGETFASLAIAAAGFTATVASVAGRMGLMPRKGAAALARAGFFPKAVAAFDVGLGCHFGTPYVLIPKRYHKEITMQPPFRKEFSGGSAHELSTL